VPWLFVFNRVTQANFTSLVVSVACQTIIALVVAYLLVFGADEKGEAFRVLFQARRTRAAIRASEEVEVESLT